MNVDDIARPVIVRAVELDPNRLPSWEPVLADLPVGCGIKGGLARKILKVISGLKYHHPDLASELNGDGDLDILVAVGQVTVKNRLAVRQAMSGQKMGDMEIEPKDIEVSDDIARYFRTRDVTMNEALVFRLSPDAVFLLFTEDAQRDVSEGIIRPAVHCLHSVFTQIWMFDQAGNAVLTPKVLVRCILRYLKGHGVSYGIDHDTWSYYHNNPLSPRDHFRLLRFYADDDERFSSCIEHLKAIGLVAEDVDANYLWGDCLYEVNMALARHGRRLTFAEPTAEQIESWIATKEHEYAQWLIRRQAIQAIGSLVEPDIQAEVVLPQNWGNFPVIYS